MEEFDARLHRTWVQYLVESNFREVAALVIDGDIDYRSSGKVNVADDVYAGLPPSAYQFAMNDVHIREVMTKTLADVAEAQTYFYKGVNIYFRMKLLDIEPEWKDVVREMIVNSKDGNQGSISEKLFNRKHKQVLIYNEMKFASQTEVRIAQELEARQILFFPLPLAVRADTGEYWKDHREPDFLICDNGVWGILEVSYHPDRFEKDAEKNAWFKKSGILCVESYTAERCYEQSGQVVDEFLGLLARYRR